MTNAPTLRRTAWHEAGHAVVAWDRGLTVVLVSVRPGDDGSFGRERHILPSGCDSETERQRENVVAMGGWAAENASGEAATRKAAAAFEREQRRRDAERRKEDAARERGRAKRDKMVAKAQAALEKARRAHEERAESLEAERTATEKRIQAEDARWESEKGS
jgi:hypothetical protein